jgi:hypothetical protein
VDLNIVATCGILGASGQASEAAAIPAADFRALRIHTPDLLVKTNVGTSALRFCWHTPRGPIPPVVSWVDVHPAPVLAELRLRVISMHAIPSTVMPVDPGSTQASINLD